MNILRVLTEKRKTGNLGEKAAAKYLKRHGYKIIRRNYVGAGHEIDIIAKNKSVTAFIEVKTRTLGSENAKEPRPASAVTPKKQRDIITASKYFLAQADKATRVRFDVIEVFISQKDKKTRVNQLKHLEGAFNLNSAYRR